MNNCEHQILLFGAHDSFRNWAVCADCSHLVQMPDLKDYTVFFAMVKIKKPMGHRDSGGAGKIRGKP